MIASDPKAVNARVTPTLARPSSFWRIVTAVFGMVIGAAVVANASTVAQNKAIVAASFDRWKAGTGSPFELLTPSAEWTIVGSSPLSKSYRSRQQFLNIVIKPFNARLATPLKPAVRGIYGDGDTVVIFFDARAKARDGKPYANTYTWYFTMKNGKVLKVYAFFDTRDFDDLFTRVSAK